MRPRDVADQACLDPPTGRHHGEGASDLKDDEGEPGIAQDTLLPHPDGQIAFAEPRCPQSVVLEFTIDQEHDRTLAQRPERRLQAHQRPHHRRKGRLSVYVLDRTRWAQHLDHRRITEVLRARGDDHADHLHATDPDVRPQLAHGASLSSASSATSLHSPTSRFISASASSSRPIRA